MYLLTIIIHISHMVLINASRCIAKSMWMIGNWNSCMNGLHTHIIIIFMALMETSNGMWILYLSFGEIVYISITRICQIIVNLVWFIRNLCVNRSLMCVHYPLSYLQCSSNLICVCQSIARYHCITASIRISHSHGKGEFIIAERDSRLRDEISPGMLWWHTGNGYTC